MKILRLVSVFYPRFYPTNSNLKFWELSDFFLKRKRKREEEQEKNKRKKLDWKTKMSDITPVLISAQITKPGKVSSVPQVRKFLVKEKKLARKDQKTITETNVVEKWAELYGNALG